MASRVLLPSSFRPQRSALLRAWTALCELPATEDSVLVLSVVHDANSDDECLCDDVPLEEPAPAPAANRLLRHPQDRRSVPHLRTTEVQGRWAGCREFRRLHHDSCDFPSHQRMDLLPTLLLPDGDGSHNLRH